MENKNLERPNYYGVLPADVRYDPDITANAKVFFTEITALTNITGTCWATNKYFADLYGVLPNRISVWVKQLETKGFIRTKVKRGGLRSISIVRDPYAKTEAPLTQKRKHNNTSNNISTVDLESQLLSLVNEVTGRAFRTLPARGVKKTLDAFTLDEIRASLVVLAHDDWHKPKLKELSIDYFIRSTTIDRFLEKGKKVASNEFSRENVTIENQEEMVRKRMAPNPEIERRLKNAAN